MTAANHVVPITQIAERLRKLVLLLSSDLDGEVVGAARAIDRALRSAGCDWHDLVKQLDSTPTNIGGGAEFHNWHSMREFCLRHARLLRPREHQFVAELGNWHGDLTEKQMNWLAAIHSRLQGQPS
jgi:hypothetical protein